MELEDIVNEEMLTTEDVNDMLEHTDKGRTKQTIRNCVTVLQKDLSLIHISEPTRH